MDVEEESERTRSKEEKRVGARSDNLMQTRFPSLFFLMANFPNSRVDKRSLELHSTFSISTYSDVFRSGADPFVFILSS